MQAADTAELIDSIISELDGCIQKLGIDAYCNKLRDLDHWRRHAAPHVVFCGEFNRGKSSIINALLDTDICLTNVLPETAVPAILEYGPELTARIEYLKNPPTSIEPTAATLRQFSADSGASLEQVHHVHITVPSTLLQRGLVLVDTPGVNDLSEQRSDITYGFLPLADAAVLVLDATAPVTKSEAAFLTGKLLPTSFQRLMFVLGKSDRLSQEDLEEAIDGAQQRLRALVRLHDGEVIPVSALRRDNGHCPCISTLRERLIALASESHDSREDLTRRRLTILITEILHEVESRIAIARMRPHEQALCRRDMEEGRTEIVSRHATFSKYVDTFGRDSLFSLVAQSLASCQEQLRSELLHTVDLLDGRVEDFMRKQVPFRVSQCLQQWASAKGPELHTFLSRFGDRVSEDYAAAFAAPLGTVKLHAGLDIPDILTPQPVQETKRVREMIVQHLLPTSVPMVAGYLLLGPFGLIGGSILGRIAEAKLNEQILNDQKREARTCIDQLIRDTFESFGEALNASLTAWFDALKRLLAEDLSERTKVVEQRYLEGTERADKELTQACNRLNALKSRLEGYENE